MQYDVDAFDEGRYDLSALAASYNLFSYMQVDRSISYTLAARFEGMFQVDYTLAAKINNIRRMRYFVRMYLRKFGLTANYSLDARVLYGRVHPPDYTSDMKIYHVKVPENDRLSDSG